MEMSVLLRARINQPDNRHGLLQKGEWESNVRLIVVGNPYVDDHIFPIEPAGVVRFAFHINRSIQFFMARSLQENKRTGTGTDRTLVYTALYFSSQFRGQEFLSFDRDIAAVTLQSHSVIDS